METFTDRQLKNLHKMLDYRKYTKNTSISANEDKIFYNDVNNIVVCIEFIDSEKINVDNIRIFISYLNRHNYQHGIVICKNEPSIQVLKEINNTRLLNIFFEIFHANQLNINISEHVLVPQHILLTKEIAQQIKKQYNVKSFSFFPKIMYSDAMARYIGANIGDLIKIVKPEEYVTYRFVIPDKI